MGPPNFGRYWRRGTRTVCRHDIWPCSMRVADIATQRVAVWGLGREGRAAIAFLRQRHPSLPLLVLDHADGGRVPENLGTGIEYAFGADRIAGALANVDIIVKSPGVSLYRREIQAARAAGRPLTSPFYLSFFAHLDLTTSCVCAANGGRTTGSLISCISV